MSVLDRHSYVNSEPRRALSLTESRLVSRGASTPAPAPASAPLLHQPCSATWVITLPSGETGRLTWQIDRDGASSVLATADDGASMWLRGRGSAEQSVIDGLLHVQALAMSTRGEVRLISVHDASTGRLLYASTTACDALSIGGGCMSEPQSASDDEA